ncbi:MAG: type IV pilus biogenesis protein PilM [bacterium]
MFLSKYYHGLEFSFQHLKAVQIKRHGNKMIVEKAGLQFLHKDAYGEGVILQPKLVAEAITALWDQLEFTRAQVIVSIGGPQVLFRILNLPKMKAKELRTALYWELENHFPHSAPEMVYDYTNIGFTSVANGGQEKILVVGTTRRLIDSYLETFDLAGIEVRALEPEVYALLRILELNQGCNIILAFKDYYTNFMLTKAGKLLYNRVLPWGSETLSKDEQVLDKLFVPECYRSLQFCQEQVGGDIVSFDEILIWGAPVCLIEYLGEKLKARLRLPVRRNVFYKNQQLSWSEAVPEEKRGLFTIGVGSALREVKVSARH